MFRLNKWYLDLVTSDGVAVICYAARLRWGPVRLRYAAILVDTPGAKPDEAVAVRRVERPAINAGVLRWRCDALDVDGEWRRQQPALRATLLRGKAGAIRWSCRMPLATANLRWGQRRFTGLGYVETLGMTVAPTRLPFQTLRWGRHLSAAHSLVWIDWTGQAPGRWIWLDGVRQDGATINGDGSVHLAGGQRLQLSDARDIRNRLVVPSIVAALPGIARRAGSLGTMREHKMAARSTLYQEHLPLDQGWTVYETVKW
jgi:hypothetical protein